VAGVWVGFDQERPLGHQEVGGRAAAPIWLYFMEKALAGTPVETFPVPEGIVFARVGARGDPEGGARGYIYECFLEGTVPENLTPISPRDVGPARREEEEE